MSNDLYQKLDNSLEQLQQSDISLDELKAGLSQGQQELQSLLALAQSLDLLEPDSASPAFVRNARIRIWNRIRANQEPSRRATPRKRSLRLTWQRAFAGVFLALLLVFSGLGVASASALPGDALYNLKRGFESVQMALAFSQGQQAGLLAQFAQERVDEIDALSQLDRPDDLTQALDDYSQTMDDFLSLSTTLGDDLGDDLDEVQNAFSHNIEVLQAVQQRVPDVAQDAIQQAIERSNHGQAVLEILEQGGNPSELAPGQQDLPNNNSDSQFNDHSNNGNAYGHDKNNSPNDHSNHGRGNPHNQGTPPVDPQDIVEDAQSD
jgi:hypothetical protein